MTITARQPPAFTENNTASSVVLTLGENPLASSLLTAQVFSDTAATVSMSGGGVGTWLSGVASTVSGAVLQTFYGLVTGSPSTAVTASFSTTVDYCELVGGEFTGVASVGPNGTASGTGTTLLAPTLTLATAGDLILLTSLAEGGVTANTPYGFTDVFNPSGAFSVYSWIIIATSTYQPEVYVQNSAGWFSQTIAFNPMGAGAPGIAGYPSVVGQSVKRASLY